MSVKAATQCHQAPSERDLGRRGDGDGPDKNDSWITALVDSSLESACALSSADSAGCGILGVVVSCRSRPARAAHTRWRFLEGSVDSARRSRGNREPLGIAQFASDTSANVTLATDFLDRSSGWAALENADGIGAWSSSGYQLVLAVPMLASGRATLAKGARGAYDVTLSLWPKTSSTRVRTMCICASDGSSTATGTAGVCTTRGVQPSSRRTSGRSLSQCWPSGEAFKFIWSPVPEAPMGITAPPRPIRAMRM